MSDSSYDPFDVSHTDQSYSGNALNPDFARNLLAFGSSMMVGANARTPGGFLQFGTGALGPIGAGIQGAMQQNLAAGRTRSELGLQRAQTQDVMSQATQRDISNRLALYNLNLQSGVMGGPQFDEQGRPLPVGVQSPYSVDFGQPAQGSGQPASSRGQVAPFIAKNLPAGVSPTEDQMVRTVYGEAGSEPLAGQQAVAQVVQNRVKLSGQSPQDVIFASGQFEPWGNAQTRAKLESLDPSSPQYQSILTNAVRPVMAGAVNDPTGGATHFYSPIAQAQLGRQPPEWAQNAQPSASIGGHQFYRIGYGGGGAGGGVAARTGGTDIAQAGGSTTDAGNPLLGRFPGGVTAPGGGVVPGSAQGAASSQINPQMLLRQVITGQRPLTTLSPTEAGAIAPLASRIWPDTGKALTEYSLAGPKAGAEAAGKLPLVGPTAAAEANAQVPAKLAAEGFMPTPDGSGVTYIPGGKQDPDVIRRQEVGKAQGQNVELRTNSMVLLSNPDGSRTMVKNPALEKVTMPDGSKRYAHISPPPPNAPPGTPGETSYVVDDSGKFMNADQAPLQQAFQHTRGEHLAEQQDKIDAEANAAKESNYLFDNMRHDSQTWDMGKFANFEGEARAYVSAIAQVAGIKTPGLNEKLADYQAFNKSSGSLLRTAVHDTSSKAAAQEYTMIGQTLPTPTTSQQGFGQIADQWQGLSDYKLAKQQYARGYLGKPEDLNVDFNTKVSPTSFMLNRMQQTAQGNHDMQTMLARMQESDEGKLLARRMLQQYQYAKQNGMFDGLP